MTWRWDATDIPARLRYALKFAPTDILTLFSMFVMKHCCSAIAMIVELLAGALVGDNFSYETSAKDNKDGGPPSGGEFILAISPEKIAGSNWAKHSDDFFKKMSSMDGVRLPGERRHKNRLDTGPRKINKELIEKIKDLSN